MGKEVEMEFNPDKCEAISISNKRNQSQQHTHSMENRSKVPNTLASLLTISYHGTHILTIFVKLNIHEPFCRETPVCALVTSNPVATRHTFVPFWCMPPLCGITKSVPLRILIAKMSTMRPASYKNRNTFL